ncbi:lipopolysaccharide biosynthesis glycosyltransferase [Microbacterium ginsengiterrae]|uniref:Lipopolysaccharide biosynthesis glycosyltransferase n=1 Tax=Microbacterium ginsengiterrae TaxID=546115 RepID=A0A7W9CD38_9MICO|nr:glycosyltransferase family 8 protein [Microbacterium ginsengiterrae]MBB5743371.1 lipopolysaccharide biosynthesis glycosyltransferase [Microbacterium ginsengiterrae]
MSGERLHVAMCVDEGYALPLAVSLASLDGASAGTDVTVHIVHPGFSRTARERIASKLSNLRVAWIAIEGDEVAGASYSWFLSRGSLFRLLLGELLPPDVERVLYLDADILVSASPAALIAQDLQGRTLGAVRDANTPWAASMMGSPWRRWGIDPASPYFNSGVLLIDLRRWRAREVGTRSIDLLRDYTPRWGDQDALNAVLEGDWVELHRRWNLQTPVLTGDSPDWALWRAEVESAVAAPGVVHFTGLDKPWNHGTEHPMASQWMQWLDRTAWAGWRADAPKEGRLEAVGRRAVRWYRARRDRRVSHNSVVLDLDAAPS